MPPVTPTVDVPFPTFVVGSLPRPQWVRELIEDRKRGDLSEDAAQALLDDAVPSAIRLQERAGLDSLSDGEWRRESYVKVVADAVDGFRPHLLPAGPASPGCSTPPWWPRCAPGTPVCRSEGGQRRLPALFGQWPAAPR
jgi:methionine synthase II (cobalamin-independent)